MGSMIILTSKLNLYSNFKIVFIVIFIVLLIITIIYGTKVRAMMIIGKKTGLSKKKEIALMKAGKAIKRRSVQKKTGEMYTVPISYINENSSGTEKLAETVALETPETEETIVLNQEMLQKEADGFHLLKNIVVVHGKKLAL